MYYRASDRKRRVRWFVCGFSALFRSFEKNFQRISEALQGGSEEFYGAAEGFKRVTGVTGDFRCFRCYFNRFSEDLEVTGGSRRFLGRFGGLQGVQGALDGVCGGFSGVIWSFGRHIRVFLNWISVALQGISESFKSAAGVWG